MTTVTVKSTKPPIKLVSERSGITLVIDRSITTTSGGGSGTVTNVSASAPLSVTSPTTTPAISISAATVSAAGTLSAADKTKLDSLAPTPGFLAPSSIKTYSIPGFRPSVAVTATGLQSANRLYYEPWTVASTTTLDRVAVEVVTAAAASTVIRLGIYNASSAWVPTTLVLDCGTVAADVVGINAATVSVTLPPGRYICCWGSNGGPALRQTPGTQDSFPGHNGSAGIGYINSMYLDVSATPTVITSGLSATATAASTFAAQAAQAGFNYLIRARWA